MGWVLDIPVLKSIHPSWVTVKPNTAVALMLAGVSLGLSQPLMAARAARFARVLAAAVALVGGLTLVEYLAGWNLGIDQLLLPEAPGAVLTFSPGRMAPNTALALVLLGSALLILDLETRRGARPAEWLAIVVSLVALVSLVGHTYGILGLTGVAPYTRMALPTAALLLVLGAGVLTHRPDRGLMATLAGAGAGGAMARRLILGALVLPIVLSAAAIKGHRAGLYGASAGVALFVVLGIAILIALIWWTGRAVSRADAERTRAAGTYQGLFDGAPDALLVVDRRGRITLWNRQAERMFGYAGDELAGASIETLVPEDSRERHAADRSRYLDQPRLREMARGLDLVALRKDGSTFPVDISLSPIQFEEGLHVIATVRDQTAQRAAQESLRQSEESLSSFVENAAFAIYRSMPDGRLVMGNRALAKMLGYDSAQELLALPDMAAVYRDPAERAQLIERFRDRDVIEDLDVVWRRKDGTPVTARLNGRTVRDSAGHLLSFEMMAEDVTEKTALEQQVRQSQKIEALGLLAGGIAHDFNNLLTTIMVTTELLLEAQPNEAPSREDLELIRGAAQRGAALTRKLLAFGRKERLDLKPVRIADVLDGFAQVLRRTIRENIGIRLLCVDHNAVVAADAGALEQVLLNLATNARDAMPDGGTLVIQTERAALDEEDCAGLGFSQPGSYALLTVSDTGTGMDEQTRQRAFDPFFTTKAEGRGSGLGMSTVYGLVKQHGGFVLIDSSPGIGTTIRIYFPLSPESPEEPRRRMLAEHLGGTETILLVEDEDSVRRVTKRLLEKHGYRVLVAEDGVEGLDLFLKNEDRVSLVLSDIVMPRRGGAELVAELRRRGKPVKVLLTSGYSSRESAEAKAVDPGIPMVPKPWAAEELLARVRQMLDEPA